ncbi:MAG: aminotransferase class III-fold pyridoxal phosphate-dependent enzyme [Actinomycetota bacterium]|nr:aminotransferase class III-fold pyridoxal phosphate-dependent enzyme [Actinomycetota bacterium]
MDPSGVTADGARVLHPDLNDRYLKLVSGEGVYVIDDSGRRYLDAAAGVGVMSLGYGRADLAAVLADQASRIPYVHSMRFRNDPQEALAEGLRKFVPEGLNSFFFCAGGSEALESTVKLVRQYWLDAGEPSRWKVIGRSPSFHGNTLMGLSVGFHGGRRTPHQPLLTPMPHVQAPWTFRCGDLHSGGGAACDVCSGKELERVILEEGPDAVAAFVAEPIVGAAAPGVTPPAGYYENVRAICDRYGVLFIADEVICGLGRTGRDFGIQHWDAIPDVLFTAKGIGGGYASLAAVAVHDRVVEVLASASGRFEHNFTMAGNPLSCAVGAAVLSAYQEEGLLENVRGQEEWFFSTLEDLKTVSPYVADVRGRGFLVGIEFTEPGTKNPLDPQRGFAREVDRRCREQGLLVYPCSGIVDGRAGDAILLMPPLTTTRSELQEIRDRLAAALSTI